ncbi:type II secretion system protein [Campylobacter geochelonis]|uniref:type II secretion system protein n=1 Tax=Campylobacter geochelonis TaxID=1780362 RepID=UPI0007707CFB|nr:type II secretion system protein [Campylobacter geochelonis]CZE47617.1 prepilin-type N-terminal cleavage/methylation domain-containing protein [Campylobacter geochelonis]
MTNMKKAFTLIELIMVIILIAILSTFGTDIYTNIYRNYIYAKSINELETQTELALEQISARLSDRIPAATIGRKSGGINNIENIDSTYTILEWIGQSVETRNLYSNDATVANRHKNSVGWSGYIDVDRSISATNLGGVGIIITPGSKLVGDRSATTVLTSLGVARTNLAVIFADYTIGGNGSGYGFNGSSADIAKVMRVNLNNTNREIMNVNDADRYSGKISERYYLAHTAYALVPGTNEKYTAPDGTEFNTFDLKLHYNYRPWNGERYDNGARIQTIAQNVTLFRFRGNFGSIELKLCMRDPNFRDSDFIVCKSKVVY